MEHSERIFLKRGQVIALALAPGEGAAKEFLVQGLVGEGGSCVCYEAVSLRDGQPGKLKEFYPAEAAGRNGRCCLERQRDGQLVSREDTDQRFGEMCRDYLRTYSLLYKAMEENHRNQVLKNYIQNGEILYGCVPEGTPAVYIWSPGILGQGFDAYLIQVRAEPAQDANCKLSQILNTVYTLTDCIRALHCAGLMHLDIKPGNFLVPFNSQQGINPNSVSLFDINTLYPVRSRIPAGIGTEGYRAPEIARGRADNRSDLYSIGAMLFYAIVISQEIHEGIYRDAYYPDIDQLVKHSQLICHTNAGTKLVSRLASILKKCLARNPGSRYESCGDLMEDLHKACFEASQIAVDPRLIGHNKRLKVVDVNEQGINSPDIVIQKLLYEHPLYEALPLGKKQVHVLVLGSGTFGQKFMDHCLQACQIMGYSICVSTVSNTPQEDRDTYLQFRPALGRFVDIDGSLERPWGEVRFLSVNEACGENGGEPLSFDFSGSSGAHDRNSRLLGDVFRQGAEGGNPFDYVFIALGSTGINRTIAQICGEALGRFLPASRIPVCYIDEESRRSDGNQASSLCPVYVNEPITPGSINASLEQMVFNTHIAYDGAFSTDLKGTYERLRKDKYNYTSSLAYALSVPYKLFSLGIVMQNPGRTLTAAQFPDARIVDSGEEAARVFQDTVLSHRDQDAEAKARFDTLVCLEHRRWVLSKVCQGWDAPRDARGNLDLHQCVASGMVQNQRKFTHPCLVASTATSPLSGEDYRRHDKWEAPDIDPELDDLDRMSLELHQRFRARAEDVRADNPLSGGDMQALEALVLTGEEPVLRAFRQFRFCLGNLLSGSARDAAEYPQYAQQLADALGRLEPEMADSAQQRLELISKTVFPVREASLYRNYKAYDQRLVEKIPFILTFRYVEHLTVVLPAEEKSSVLSWIAGATVLNPGVVQYLCCFRDDDQGDQLVQRLEGVLNYWETRNPAAGIVINVLCQEHVSGAMQRQLQGIVARWQRDYSVLQDTQLQINSTGKSWEAWCLDQMHQHPAAIADLSPLDGDGQVLQSLLESREIPWFEFDWKNTAFTRCSGCAQLRNVQDRACLRVRDLLALVNGEITDQELPEFPEEEQVLWKLAGGEWDTLCYLLREYDRQPPLAVFPPHSDTGKRQEMIYVLPDYVLHGARQQLKTLAAAGVIGPGYQAASYGHENCKIRLLASGAYAPQLEALFARPELLLPYYGMRVDVASDGTVTVTCQDLQVTQLDLKGREHLLLILYTLKEHHLISGLTWADGKAGFTYVSGRVKELMTTSGAAEKRAIYHQMRQSGDYDDIVGSCRIHWRNQAVWLDAGATAGFRLSVMGSGPDRKALEALVKELEGQVITG